jgi:hypothetical protein
LIAVAVDSCGRHRLKPIPARNRGGHLLPLHRQEPRHQNRKSIVGGCVGFVGPHNHFLDSASRVDLAQFTPQSPPPESPSSR